MRNTTIMSRQGDNTMIGSLGQNVKDNGSNGAKQGSLLGKLGRKNQENKRYFSGASSYIIVKNNILPCLDGLQRVIQDQLMPSQDDSEDHVRYIQFMSENRTLESVYDANARQRFEQDSSLLQGKTAVLYAKTSDGNKTLMETLLEITIRKNDANIRIKPLRGLEVNPERLYSVLERYCRD